MPSLEDTMTVWDMQHRAMESLELSPGDQQRMKAAHAAVFLELAQALLDVHA